MELAIVIKIYQRAVRETKTYGESITIEWFQNVGCVRERLET
jgi:hypothetical protein